MPHFKRKRAVPEGECLNSPSGLERHSPPVQLTIKIESTTKEKEVELLVEQKNLSPSDPWVNLVERANEDHIVINWHLVTALLDTGSQVTDISEAFCQAKRFQIHPLSQLVEIEGTGGNSIKYIGYIEAKLALPLGSHAFEVEAFLLVLPTTDYQNRVPVAIGTTVTDMVVDYIYKNQPNHVSKSWKAVCCATQSRQLVQAQPTSKYFVRTTKPVTLPPSPHPLLGEAPN